jgi:hypothetical protein
MRDVLIQDRAQVPGPGDQHPVGDLGPGCPYPAFGIGVRPGTARRDLHRLDPRSGQHRTERFGELPGPVPDLTLIGKQYAEPGTLVTVVWGEYPDPAPAWASRVSAPPCSWPPR